ncbi:MAG: aminotransferase class V-fold PLP-dependent enzyme [Pseudomonadota bacterium]
MTEARERYYVPEGIYLLSHSVGCLPKSSRAALDTHFVQPWVAAGGDAWGPWLDAVNRFRDELSLLLNARAGEFCPQANLSSALVKFLTALPAAHKTRRVLMHASAFPSLGFAVKALASLGFEPRLIDEALPADDPDVWERHIDDSVAALLITHVHSNTGIASPVAELISLARRHDILSIVDIAQSVGVLPIDLATWQPDVALGSCVKWLCGGPGAGFLWIRADLNDMLRPIDVGWFSHEDPFEWDIRDFRYAPDALKFWGGTPSVAPYAIAAESIRVARETGVDAMRAHNLNLLEALVVDLPAERFSHPPLANAGGTACITVTDTSFTSVVEALKTTGARFDTRGQTLRLSPHVYNTAEEMSVVCASLAAG